MLHAASRSVRLITAISDVITAFDQFIEYNRTHTHTRDRRGTACDVNALVTRIRSNRQKKQVTIVHGIYRINDYGTSRRYLYLRPQYRYCFFFFLPSALRVCLENTKSRFLTSASGVRVRNEFGHRVLRVRLPRF